MTITTCRVLVVLLALSTAPSQARVTVQRIRVSEGVSYSMADRKVLPDIAGLKGHQLNAKIAVVVLISKSGDVTDARAIKGDPDLLTRSEVASRKWHFRAYVRNGSPIEFDTMVEFRFTKDKVEIVVPPGH